MQARALFERLDALVLSSNKRFLSSWLLVTRSLTCQLYDYGRTWASGTLHL